MKGIEKLSDLFLAACRARETRLLQGLLRATPDEIQALSHFLDARSSLSTIDSQTWAEIEIRLAAENSLPVCRCGHTTTHHHDEQSGCFHIIGCSTACSCERYEPDPASKEKGVLP